MASTDKQIRTIVDKTCENLNDTVTTATVERVTVALPCPLWSWILENCFFREKVLNCFVQKQHVWSAHVVTTNPIIDVYVQGKLIQNQVWPVYSHKLVLGISARHTWQKN